MNKLAGLVYALAWQIHKWLTAFLGISEPVVYRDRPDTQETIAAAVAALDELKLENAELRELLSETPTGPDRPNAKKLTDREVKEIREYKRAGFKNAELADMFDVNPATISRIVRGQYHKTA